MKPNVHLINVVIATSVTIFVIIVSVNAEKCEEKVVSGRKTVSCTGYSQIPRNLDPEIMGLDLIENNHIATLLTEEFKVSNLIHLKRIRITSAKLRNIKDGAFEDMNVLSDLDLSNNHLYDLQLHSFTPVTALRVLSVANNRNLHQLRGEFPNLQNLKQIDMSNCNLTTIDGNVFKNLNGLEVLKLNGNQLKTLSEDVLKPLYNLNTFDIGGNQWNCDCYLRKIIERMFPPQDVISRSISSNLKPVCSAPPSLVNRTWDSVDTKIFHCMPKVNWLTVNEEIETREDETFYPEVGSNITVECEFWADPPADVQWIKNDKPLKNSSAATESEGTHIIQYNSYNHHIRSLKLIIRNGQPSDIGEYMCRGENVGGVALKTVYLNFTGAVIVDDVIVTGGNPTKVWLWILIGLLCLLILISIVTAIVCFVLRRQQHTHNALKPQVMEKFKDSQIVIDDIDGNKSGNQDDGRTPLLRTGKYSPTSQADSGLGTAEFAHLDYRTSDYRQPTMAVPPSRPGSSASSVMNPELEFRRQAFRTQHSTPAFYDSVRYQKRPPSITSFASLPPPEVHHGYGYVTLPRKPRGPSWTPYAEGIPMPPPSPAGSLGVYSTQPLAHRYRPRSNTGGALRYDTAGPRTTSDGSTLSLNKVGTGSTNTLDSINNGLSTTSRGKIKNAKSYSGSCTTPLTSRSLGPYTKFNFDSIQETEESMGKPRLYQQSMPQNQNRSGHSTMYKKKPAPVIESKSLRLQNNFRQRGSIINKSFENPNNSGNNGDSTLGRPKSINNSDGNGAPEVSDVMLVDSLFNFDSASPTNLSPPPPPPKPLRKHSYPEFSQNGLTVCSTIQEEVEGTAV